MKPSNLANSMGQEAQGGGLVEQFISNMLDALLT